jgi:YebC/PmpR family DNA-binding regulatory protein
MSGHSRWSSIKHKKAAKDAKRGKLFNKLIKEITVAARLGGGDVAANPRLRAAVVSARAGSMPSDTIERAIKKGSGELEGVDYVDITYEGYGPGGVAIMLECLTDNRNRTVQEIRSLFDKNAGHLGETGCVSWIFERVGQLRTARAPEIDETAVLEASIDAGASDVIADDGAFVVTMPPQALESVRSALAGASIEVEAAEVVLQPKTHVPIAGSDAAQTLHLLELLEDHDDVQRVSANFEIDDEELKRLSA